MKKIAVVLSGCGVYDGAEIHEAVLTLYAIAVNGAAYEIFAPDIDQHHVVNHLAGSEMNESRNVLVESARIARGNIKALSEFNGKDFDAIIFPGGFGAAKNLSTFAFDGSNCQVNSDVEAAIKEMISLGKPVGALCIAPVILARILFGCEHNKHVHKHKQPKKVKEAVHHLHDMEWDSFREFWNEYGRDAFREWLRGRDEEAE